MKWKILFILVLAQINPSWCFIAQLMGLGAHGGRSSNCLSWSSWSPCFGTNDYDFFSKMPQACYQNQQLSMVLGFGRPFIEKVFRYAESMNHSAHACGMCNVQLSCSPKCTQQAGGNPFGIIDRYCPGLTTGRQACAMKSSAFEPSTGRCKVWPPKDKQPSDFLPPILPQTVKSMIWNDNLLNCISVGGRCFCCCFPFKVNPCDATCVENPCDTGSAFTNDQIIALRQRSLQSAP